MKKLQQQIRKILADGKPYRLRQLTIALGGNYPERKVAQAVSQMQQQGIITNSKWYYRSTEGIAAQQYSARELQQAILNACRNSYRTSEEIQYKLSEQRINTSLQNVRNQIKNLKDQGKLETMHRKLKRYYRHQYKPTALEQHRQAIAQYGVLPIII